VRPWRKLGGKMITVAKEAGFCFGVRRATDLVEQLIKDKGENDIICTFGKLIHNEAYNEYLAKAGVENVDFSKIGELYKLAKSGKNVTLVLRTHGIERELYEELNSYSEKCSQFKVVDCACPYVKKIHKIAKENSEDGQSYKLDIHLGTDFSSLREVEVIATPYRTAIDSLFSKINDN
jgi:4-hydroxy-3-methylbut-2-enyl diphosphate reductase